MQKTCKKPIFGALVVLRIIWSLASGLPLRFLEIVGQALPENAWGCKARGAFYKPSLRNCGRNFQVALHVKLEHLKGIEVGDNVYIGHGSWISGLRGGIVFEDEVMLGPYYEHGKRSYIHFLMAVQDSEKVKAGE